MANKGAFADFVVVWQRLVTNVLANSAELPEQMEVYRTALQEVLERVLEKSARLRIRRGVKQQEQRELEVDMRNGRFHASKLRAGIIAHYGPQSERLLDYDIRPRRSRPRPAGETEEPTPEEPEQEDPAPEVEIQGVKTVEAPKLEDPTPTPQGKPAK
jgi:hypothetical protein